MESWQPLYRVNFWSQPPAPPGIPQEQIMWHSHEYELRGAGDVHEVMAWADANADGRVYTLHAVLDLGGERALIRLAGENPTRAVD